MLPPGIAAADLLEDDSLALGARPERKSMGLS